ncbi:hypothetical protein [Parapedobacter soli]|uniref:hypothetical protein n=1 Tax=Parapedobacter soli TaxID=416955 RepID=UPI0021C806C4|nr:hypothetical protein [Parapedobacter soli]
MKRLSLLLVMLSMGMLAWAQIDAVSEPHKRNVPRRFLNDRELFGSIDPLDPKEIVRLEIDKELDAVKVYTVDQIKEVITLERYLRKCFKNYGRNSNEGVFVDSILVDDPSHSIIWPEVIKSVTVSFDPDAGPTEYHIETFGTNRKPAQGGIRMRGAALL